MLYHRCLSNITHSVYYLFFCKQVLLLLTLNRQTELNNENVSRVIGLIYLSSDWFDPIFHFLKSLE